MAKYCIYCGQVNDDQALFCTACGKSFPVQQGVSPPVPVQSATPVLYAAERGPGAHKHMPTDIYLRDSQGKQLLVARLQSLLHRNYTVVDDGEVTVGFIEEKTHLTHRTFTLQDVGHTVLASVNTSNVEQNRAPPNCWIEDATGNRLVNVVFTMGRLSFAAVRGDGTPSFQATLQSEGGVKEMLESASRRAYAVQLNDPSFSLQIVLTTLVALDQT